MKKIIVLTIFLLGLGAGNLNAITVSLDQKISNYDPTIYNPIISFYLSSNDYETNKQPFHQDSITTSSESIDKAHFEKKGHLSNDTKDALKKADKVFITIEFSLPKEPKSKIMLYSGYVKFPSTVKVVLAPFGENHAVGAVYSSDNGYEPKGPQNDPDYFYDLVKNVLPKKS